AERARSAELGDVVAAELRAELADGRRVVADVGGWVAWVPYASPYPYGLRVAPRERVDRLDHLDGDGRDGLAAVLADVLGRYDRLWRGDPAASAIFPYLMWFHQAPRDPAPHDHLHLHLAP